MYLPSFLRNFRRKVHLVQHIDEVEILFSEIDRLVPCENPDCISFRARAQETMRSK